MIEESEVRRFRRASGVSQEVEVILQGTEAIRVRMAHAGANGTIVIDSEGRIETLGPPAPAPLPHSMGNAGPQPLIDLFFRLAENPELGLFQYRSSSWGLAYDLAAEQHADRLATDFDGQPVKATLKLEPVSFVAKTGPRAGKTVSYTKSSLTLGQLA